MKPRQLHSEHCPPCTLCIKLQHLAKIWSGSFTSIHFVEFHIFFAYWRQGGRAGSLDLLGLSSSHLKKHYVRLSTMVPRTSRIPSTLCHVPLLGCISRVENHCCRESPARSNILPVKCCTTQQFDKFTRGAKECDNETRRTRQSSILHFLVSFLVCQ